jgi:hypothetical protein
MLVWDKMVDIPVKEKIQWDCIMRKFGYHELLIQGSLIWRNLQIKCNIFRSILIISQSIQSLAIRIPIQGERKNSDRERIRFILVHLHVRTIGGGARGGDNAYYRMGWVLCNWWVG